jgi:hypothetical protein
MWRFVPWLVTGLPSSFIRKHWYDMGTGESSSGMIFELVCVNLRSPIPTWTERGVWKGD